MVIDTDDRGHLLATRVVANTIWYDVITEFCEWETGWIELPVSTAAISAVPVSSEFDSRVALLAHNRLETSVPPLPIDSLTNDVWAFISEDGDFTDFEQVAAVNVTDLLDAETTAHPLPGHIYAFCDLDGIFDSEGNLHVVYTTQPHWYETTLLDGQEMEPHSLRWCWTGQIWHALIDPVGEVLEYSHIAGFVGENNETDPNHSGYFESDPGRTSNASIQDRPSLAIDVTSGTLYCMWRDFSNLADTSAAGFANADIFIRSSCDNGSSWGPAVNITDSQTPGCSAGNCASEAWGSLAEEVSDSMLYLEFVEDLAAGAAPYEEGVWTESPVWYKEVPIADVPCGPPWDAVAHATQLTDSYWDWGALEDGSYEIIDEMHLLNEGRETVILYSIELLYQEQLPDIDITQLNGDLGDDISPYQTGEYRYVWNAVIGDDEYDAMVRFHTSGGTVDFKLANRNPLNLETAQSFLWWVESVPGTEVSVNPQAITLAQNYPNPFNPATTIEYTLATPATVQLEIFNSLGEIVAAPVNEYRPAGTHSVVFDAGDLASGVYFSRLSVEENSVSCKMMLLR